MAIFKDPKAVWKEFRNDAVPGGQFASAEEARQAGVEHGMRNDAAQNIYEKHLEKIPTAELPKFLEGLRAAAVKQSGTVDGQAAIRELLNRHSEYVDQGQEGTLNAGRLDGLLRGRGYSAPYTLDQLEAAYAELVEDRALFLRGEPTNLINSDEEAEVDKILKRQAGW